MTLQLMFCKETLIAALKSVSTKSDRTDLDSKYSHLSSVLDTCILIFEKTEKK